MEEGKSFEISKHQVMKAYKLVKANNGAGGIDSVDFKTYEQNLKNNLYKPDLRTVVINIIQYIP